MSIRQATPAPLTAARMARWQPRPRAIRSLRLLGAIAVALALSVAAFAPAAAAADLKPGEQLPWCRVTLNMATSIDRDAPKIVEVDGWYDESTHTLLQAKTDPLGVGTLDVTRIVKVTRGAFSPQPMTKEATKAANEVRARLAAQQADQPRAAGKPAR